MSLRGKFTDYLFATNLKGSGKASSYLKALDLLNEMIAIEPFGIRDCDDLWAVRNIDQIIQLHEVVAVEKSKGEASVWLASGIPKSYLINGYCSAALKAYQNFLIEFQYEQKLLNILDENKDDEKDLPEKLEVEMANSSCLIEGLDKQVGKETLRNVLVRSNQNVFRSYVLKIYNDSCCITGLNIPEINRASHIIPWAADKSKRLDPSNGLCLSATYDAAFDRNLLSLDDEYRIIISKEIKEYYTSDIAKEYFINLEGKKINLPRTYLPNKDYLQKHRSNGLF